MTGPIASQRRIERAEHAIILQKLEERRAVVAVVGLGYVGLPLVRAVHDAGHMIVGYDVDERKVGMLREGEGYLAHLGPDFAKTLAASNRFRATSDASELRAADVVLLCVPTPLGEDDEPDLGYVLDSVELVARNQRRGQLVVLESTTYPGTTREKVAPILESRGLELGVDVFLAYSPEREDPGRADFDTRTIPRVVAGIDDASTQLAVALYETFVDEVHCVSSVEVAESAKLLENVYRAANIALVNELKIVLGAMGIDVWEVIEAARTKPFGFEPFFPGPGVGGHCVPVDPFYLAHRARAFGQRSRFVELAGEVNRRMPAWVVSRIVDALNDDRKCLRGAKVLVVGVAYKANVDDMRESPAAELIEQLRARGAVVRYHDPHVPVFPRMRRHDLHLASVTLTADELRRADCVVIASEHEGVDYRAIAEHAALVVDTRNALARRCDADAVRARVVKA